MEYNLDDITIRIMDIIHSSSVDGVGFRDVLFVNYCPHKCEGCHNPQAWDLENGKDVNLADIYNDLIKSSITNITYSGGEPFEQAQKLAILSKHIKQNTKKTIWIYSGYTFEDIIADSEKTKLLMLCDVLVDGKYEKDNTGLNLRFKGSLNQRIIDIKKSLDSDDIVLFNG